MQLAPGGISGVVEGSHLSTLRRIVIACTLATGVCISACSHAYRVAPPEIASHRAQSLREKPDRRFSSPLPGGRFCSGFGMRNGAMHDGVDICAPSGTPIHAADKGIVIFSGRLRGYGNTVIIRHDGHYVTVYSHNRANRVREGERVARSQTVAEVGTTGHTSGPNLHFEVRRDNLACNPLDYLLLAPVAGERFARGSRP